MLNEGNQIHNFVPSSDSGTAINYGSDSDFFLLVSVPVPVPLVKKFLRFLRFWFRFRSVVDPDPELFAGSGSGINHFGSGSGLIPNFSVKKSHFFQPNCIKNRNI